MPLTVAVLQTCIAHACIKACAFDVAIGNVCAPATICYWLLTPYLIHWSNQTGKKHNTPMSQRQRRKATSVCGSHISEEETPWHSLFHLQLELLFKNSRSMAHSDDLEEHKSIQTTSRKQILWTRIWYIGTLHRASKRKPLLVQPQISCNSTGLYSCSKSFGKA